MALLSMCCDAEHRSLSRINPVRCKQAAERRYEDDAAVVRDGLRQGRNFMRFVREAQVMHQELDRGARDRNGTFESVDGLAVYHPESVKGQMLS